jgi:putative tricarboxylic transport membrane protein
MLGLGAAVLAAPVMLASWRYEVGTFRAPGAGFWPFYVALAMAGLGVVLVARPAPAAASSEPGVSRWRQFSIALVTLAVYVATLEPLGYLAATAILLFVQLSCVEERPWRGSLVIAAVSSAISLIVFRTLLKVPLPLGILPLPRGW